VGPDNEDCHASRSFDELRTGARLAMTVFSYLKLETENFKLTKLKRSGCFTFNCRRAKNAEASG
jgi:hypothetical protein